MSLPSREHGDRFDLDQLTIVPEESDPQERAGRTREAGALEVAPRLPKGLSPTCNDED
jgi:hypothetical protein